MGVVRDLAVLAAVCAAVSSAAQPCPPAPAVLAVYADNRSADASLELQVSGELADDASTCAGSGTYQATLSCVGSGLVSCGTLPALRPGTWINRLAVQVAGSATQSQTRRAVLVGAGANALVWTVYPRTFVIDSVTQASLGAALAAAAARPDGALVTFSPTAFPGATSPQVIDLARKPCAPELARAAAICFEGNDVVVDGLDARGLPGGVVWSVGTRSISLLRLYGRDNVLGGLVLRGSLDTTPSTQVDTVAIVGLRAQANRFEDSTIVGPTMGDAVGVANGAGAEEANVFDRCTITGAKDKGLKVTTGAQVVVRRSCVHDNQNGGIQSTLGGHALAIENLVQHNVPGRAGNGLAVTGTDPAQPSTLVSDGNIVRFAGARGLSVVDAAAAEFHNDYVADNQFAGAKVEALTATPSASFRGVALVCNHNAGISGACEPDPTEEGTPCQVDADCCGLEGTCCVTDPDCAAPLECNPISFPLGAGAMHLRLGEQEDPSLWWGDADEAGRNAFTLNRNAPRGANFILNVAGATVSAEGNQWEHCGVAQSCDTAAVLAEDIRLATGAAVAIGQPPGLRTEAPSLTRVSPPRPGRDDLVRIFGTGLNAIDGAACAEATAPVAPCSADNPEVRNRNLQTNANRIRILRSDDGTLLATLHPDAVTPTMLAFRMPFDCFMPLTVQVSKRDASDGRLSDTIALCDAGGCAGQPAGLPCDDGSTCTLDDRCSGGPAGICTGTPRTCTGPCFTGSCDPNAGCVPRPVGASCEDGTACTVDDRCVGAAVRLCVGTPRQCAGPCLTGSCDPASGCVPRPAGASCDDGSVCTLGDTCSSNPAGVCSGTSLACAGACFTGSCDPQAGCVPQPAGTACDDGSVCTLDDGCSGTGDTCVPGAPRACGECSTGECDPLVGCLPKRVGATCRIAAGPCDVEERCDGLGADCPPDGYGAGACEDGNRCTQGDRCEGTGPTCTAGVPLACDDGNACTDDACLPERGCTNEPRTGACDDADPCTLDGCTAGRCVGVRLPPFAWESCQLATLEAAPLCPEGIPEALGETIATRLARARALLQQAADALEPRARRRRVGAAGRTLARLVTRVQRAARRGRITPACGASFGDAVLVRQEQVRGLAF
jgi:hypothetical protein